VTRPPLLAQLRRVDPQKLDLPSPERSSDEAPVGERRRVIIEPLSSSAVLHVAANMRAEDRREIDACRWVFDPEQIARETFALARFGCVAHADGVPVAVVAAVEYWPGFYTVGMFATDDWPKVALSLTRWARARMSAQLLAAGANRMECRVVQGHETAMRWLESLGAAREAALSDCGRNRESFFLYAWTRKRWEKTHVHSRNVRNLEAAPSATIAARTRAEHGRGPGSGSRGAETGCDRERARRHDPDRRPG
ncbi:MAG: hypothetical protein WCF16_10035, partial [Alphaproteobacteria bacterium]